MPFWKGSKGKGGKGHKGNKGKAKAARPWGCDESGEQGPQARPRTGVRHVNTPGSPPRRASSGADAFELIAKYMRSGRWDQAEELVNE